MVDYNYCPFCNNELEDIDTTLHLIIFKYKCDFNICIVRGDIINYIILDECKSKLKYEYIKS